MALAFPSLLARAFPWPFFGQVQVFHVQLHLREIFGIRLLQPLLVQLVPALGAKHLALPEARVRPLFLRAAHEHAITMPTDAPLSGGEAELAPVHPNRPQDESSHAQPFRHPVLAMMPAVEDTVDAPFERNILWSIEKFVLQRAQAVVADTRRSKIIARRVFLPLRPYGGVNKH